MRKEDFVIVRLPTCLGVLRIPREWFEEEKKVVVS